jgi:hypothetical protein
MKKHSRYILFVTIVITILVVVFTFRLVLPPFHFLRGQRPSASATLRHVNEVRKIQAYSFPADFSKTCAEARKELLFRGFKELAGTDPNVHVHFYTVSRDIVLSRDEKVVGVLEKTELDRELSPGWLTVTIYDLQENHLSKIWSVFTN